MGWIPGFIIAVLTFPGVLLREYGQYLACKLRKLPVFEVVFYRPGTEARAWLVHGDPESFGSSLMVCALPFLLSTLLCLAVCFPVAVPLWNFTDRSVLTFLFLWFGLSLGIQSFPALDDVTILAAASKEAVKARKVSAILSLPLVWLFRLAKFLRMIWFEGIWAIAIGGLLPWLVVKGL